MFSIFASCTQHKVCNLFEKLICLLVFNTNVNYAVPLMSIFFGYIVSARPVRRVLCEDRHTKSGLPSYNKKVRSDTEEKLKTKKATTPKLNIETFPHIA